MEEVEVKATMEQALSIFERLSLKASDSKDSKDDTNIKIPKKPSKTLSFCQKTQQPSTASSYTARLTKEQVSESVRLCYFQVLSIRHKLRAYNIWNVVRRWRSLPRLISNYVVFFKLEWNRFDDRKRELQSSKNKRKFCYNLLYYFGQFIEKFFSRARHRYKPYLLPLMSKAVDTLKRNSALEKLWNIKLDGDVDELKLMLSDQPSIMERLVSLHLCVKLFWFLKVFKIYTRYNKRKA